MLTQAHLKTLLHYNPETGVLTWLPREGSNSFNSRCAGKIAGSICPTGYLMIRIYNVQTSAHRLAYLFMEGRLPKCIDHKNGNKSDNSWLNLRECTYSENLRNTGKKSHNTSGYKGVIWHKRCGKWHSRVGFNRKKHHIGYFNTPEEAARAYDKKAIELHGEFALTNKMLGLI
jgi:hypothetical protein